MSNGVKKLFYIVNAKIPTDKANGYQISKMCEEFSKAGLEVELLVPTRESRFQGDPFEFYNISKNFKFNKIKSFDFVKYHKYLGKYSFWLQSIAYFFKLLFRKIDKDAIIYSRNPEIVWLFGLRGYKTIFEVHRWAETKIWLFEYFIKRAKKAVAVTNELKKRCLESGFSENDVLIAPDAVDLKVFDLDILKSSAREKLKLPQDKIILGYIGRFRTMGEEKGISEILKAISLLAENYSNIFFLAIGGTREDIDLYNDIAKKLGVDDKILLFEKVERPMVAIYQKACDILLMPFPYTKHFAYYMSPLKMFEYMASKRPIIASDLPSVREILNQNNAILVKPDDCKDLAEGVERIIINKELGKGLAERAFKDVQEYSWEKRAARILNFINN